MSKYSSCWRFKSSARGVIIILYHIILSFPSLLYSFPLLLCDWFWWGGVWRELMTGMSTAEMSDQMLSQHDHQPDPRWWIMNTAHLNSNLQKATQGAYQTTCGSDASALSHSPHWPQVEPLKCIKNVQMALWDSRVAKSRVFGTACVSPLTLDQILPELYLLCPLLYFHHSVKWSGIPTVLLIFKTMWLQKISF